MRRNEEMRSFGFSAGSTVEATSRMRGGGRQNDKKNKTEKWSVSPVELGQIAGESNRVITDSDPTTV